MKRVTITVSNKAAKGLERLARHGRIKGKELEYYKAFELACACRPNRSGERPITISDSDGGWPALHYIPRSFSYGD